MVAMLLNKIIIILIQVMRDFKSLTVISVEYTVKVNPVCFKCLKMINSLENVETNSET